MKSIKKSIITLVSLVVIFSIIESSTFAASSQCWYIKRNGKLQPKMEKEAALLQNYNAYYIDNEHGDNAKEKILYLTFDTGYENGNVEKILDVLKEEDVPAAFFLLDNIIIKNTDLVKRMASEGHLICNHTKNHKDLTKCTRAEIENNILALEKIYKSETGLEIAKYFRFPEGKYSENALKCVSDMGYKTIFWSFAYADWDNKNQPSEVAAIKKILDNKVKVYYEIGRLLNEAGKEYGKNVIKQYAEKLIIEVGRKYNERTLYRMRKFYEVFY